jgi:hypothetical protein
LNKDVINWFKPIVYEYTGTEPVESIRRLIGELLKADEASFATMAAFFMSSEGMGSTLKTFQASFLEAHLTDIAKLPIPAQRQIHEFRNQLSMVNQDVKKSEELWRMTFTTDGSNHDKITADLSRLYNYIQQRLRSTADRIGAVLQHL